MTTSNAPLKVNFEIQPNNYQPNIITTSRQEFTEIEKKIVVLAINQLRQVAKNWQKGQNVTLHIPYSELTNNHHSKISAAANSLNTKRIIQERVIQGNSLSENEFEFDYIVPFPRVRSIKLSNKRHLELTMLSDVVPSFIEMGKRYTSYSVAHMLSLSSIYAQRMYEIVRMFYGRGQKVFTYKVDDLRTALNYPVDHDYYDFKRKAILVAQQELQQKVGLYFEFIPSRKVGKAVVELRFDVKSTKDFINDDIEEDRLAINTMQPHEIADIAKNLMSGYKFTKKQQNYIFENAEAMSTFIRLHAEIYHGKREVKNPTAYMARSLGFGKTGPERTPSPSTRTIGRSTTDAKLIGDLLPFKVKKNND